MIVLTIRLAPHIQTIWSRFKFVLVKSWLQVFIIVFFLIAGGAEAQPTAVLSDVTGLDVYILRHAETLANITGVSTDQNTTIFSKRGQQQVAQLPEKLKAYRFDYILVSSMHRARYTILPYLEQSSMIAEIWPELGECCWQKNQSVSTSASFLMGRAITLDAREIEHFRFRDNFSRQTYNQQNYADGIMLQKKAAKNLIERFGHSGKSVLIVGHNNAGGRLIEILLGLSPEGRFYLKNAAISHLRQREDGSFQLLMLNDLPYAP